MKHTHAFRGFLTMASLTALLASATAAQQSATPAKSGTPASSPGAVAAAKPEPTPQKVVLRVGSTEVVQSQIDALISRMGVHAKAVVATEGRQPVGEQYVKMLLLSQQALDQHLDSSPEIQAQLELQRDETLADAEYQKMASAIHLSPEEISRYFAAHRSDFETIQVRQLMVRKRPPGATNPRLGLPPAEARAKAEAISKALLAGKDVNQVAADFAMPTNVVMLVDRKPQTLRRENMKPAMAKAAFALKDGGVTEPVDTPEAFIVVKVFKHNFPELKDVATEVENKARQQMLDAEIDKLREKAGVWMDEAYFKGKPPAAAPSANPQANRPAPKP